MTEARWAQVQKWASGDASLWSDGPFTVNEARELLDELIYARAQMPKMESALRNCLALARRHKGQFAWEKIVEWCALAGIKPSVLRERTQDVKGGA